MLGTGWIGLTVGMQFYLPMLVRTSGLTFRLAMIESLVTLGVVTGALWWAFPKLGLTSQFWAIVPALALGAIAVASTPAGLDIALRDRKRRQPVVGQLETSLGVNAFVAILTAGILFAWVHRAPSSAMRPPTPTEWAVITVGIGVLGGTLFHLFLGEERQVDRLVVSLGGAVILASGTAAYLNVSPVLATLVTGIVLVNTSRGRSELRSVLAAAERPFYYVLLLLAGLSWRPSTSATVIAVLALYLVTRNLSKVYATRATTAWNNATPTLGRDWGKALIGQGRLTVALALDYARRPELPIGDVVFTAALASVLLTEFAAARLVRAALLPIVEPLRDLAQRLPWVDADEVTGGGAAAAVTSGAGKAVAAVAAPAAAKGVETGADEGGTTIMGASESSVSTSVSTKEASPEGMTVAASTKDADGAAESSGAAASAAHKPGRTEVFTPDSDLTPSVGGLRITRTPRTDTSKSGPAKPDTSKPDTSTSNTPESDTPSPAPDPTDEESR